MNSSRHRTSSARPTTPFTTSRVSHPYGVRRTIVCTLTISHLRFPGRGRYLSLALRADPLSKLHVILISRSFPFFVNIVVQLQEIGFQVINPELSPRGHLTCGVLNFIRPRLVFPDQPLLEINCLLSICAPVQFKDFDIFLIFFKRLMLPESLHSDKRSADVDASTSLGPRNINQATVSGGRISHRAHLKGQYI